MLKRQGPRRDFCWLLLLLQDDEKKDEEEKDAAAVQGKKVLCGVDCYAVYQHHYHHRDALGKSRERKSRGGLTGARSFLA